MRSLDIIFNISDHDPERIAFGDGDKKISYLQLVSYSCRISSLLDDIGVVAGDHVAVLLPRGWHAAIAIYGILFSGACYIPLNVNDPIQRKQFIAEDANVKCFIGIGKQPEWSASYGWIDLTHIEESPLQATRPYQAQPDDLAAILYTSGSTGDPKGVTVTHQSINAFVQWTCKAFTLSFLDRIASLSPFYFDLSIFDLFASTAAGACTFFIPDGLTLAPSRLSQWLSDQRITTWYTVPSILSFMSIKANFVATPLPNMKRILFAGEVFPTKHLINLVKQLPKVEFFNLFGPTETNVCLYWPVDHNRLMPDSLIPIGKPACEATLCIDKKNNELLVKGPCVTRGYFRKGKMQKISENSFYCTGDKVSLNQLGEYLYHGRLDRMIKSSGYRIEPAEIEQSINTIEHVLSVAVVAIPDPASGSKIVAVICAEDNFDLNECRRALLHKLPPYMIPARFITVDTMPLLSNGKIDYQSITQICS